MENMENLEPTNNTEPNGQTAATEPADVNLHTKGQESAGNGENTPSTKGIQSPAENNLREWQKDKRYGNMWKTEDDMYKSYRELETKYPELKGKLDKLSKNLSKYGLTDENIEAELEKIADYRNPQSRINQILNYLDSWMTKDNGLYKDRVLKFFEELESDELRRKYPNMNAEQIAKQIELEQELNKLKAAEKERQDKYEYDQEFAAVNKGIAECEELCKQYGLKLTAEARNYFLDLCGKKNIPPQYMKNEFFNLYGKKLLEARDRKTIENANTNSKRLEGAKILHVGSVSAKPQGQLKGKAAFVEGFKRLFKE